MSGTYSIKDVTKDLGFLLSLTNLFTMDDQGFWCDPDADRRFVYNLDGAADGKEIVVFQDPMPKGDFYYFNPFAEGFGKKSPAVQLYYKTIRIAFNLNLRMVFMDAAKKMLAAKTDDGKNLPHALVRMISGTVDKRQTLFDVMDEKMLSEFELLWKRIDDECVFIPYLHQQMTAKVKIDALTDPKWEEKYGKDIRKKTISAFRALLMGVLGIKDVADLESFSVKYDPDTKSSARMHTTISVYLKLYSRFNDVLAEAFGTDGVPAESAEVNLGELQEVIDRFPLAYAIAKHMVQPELPKTKTHDTSTVDTSKLSFAQPGNATGTSSRFAGPEVIDDFGRRGRSGQQLAFAARPEQKTRFSAHVIETKNDPFAPLTRSNNAATAVGWGQPTSPAGGDWAVRPAGGGGGYFGGGGIDLTPPSNFGSPGVTRSYFG